MLREIVTIGSISTNKGFARASSFSKSVSSRFVDELFLRVSQKRAQRLSPRFSFHLHQKCILEHRISKVMKVHFVRQKKNHRNGENDSEHLSFNTKSIYKI